MDHCVFICATCAAVGEAPKGAVLASELEAAFAASGDTSIDGFDVRLFECMNACGHPNAISFRAEGKAAHLFADVDPVNDQDDIVAFAKLYAASKDGWIDDATSCGRLRFCLQGRIPAMGTGQPTDIVIPPK